MENSTVYQQGIYRVPRFHYMNIAIQELVIISLIKFGWMIFRDFNDTMPKMFNELKKTIDSKQSTGKYESTNNNTKSD